MKKKGSLSLSVNAIVILILAIVMLGLGLGFVRGMFGKVSEEFGTLASQEQAPPQATGVEPITISRENVVSQGGAVQVLKLSVFNPSSSPLSNAKPSISCLDTSFVITGGGESFTRNIAPGKSEAFILKVTIPAAPANTYLCQISASTLSYKKDLTITVSK